MKKKLLLLLAASVSLLTVSCDKHGGGGENPEPPVDGDYVVVPSKTYLSANGQDKIEFTVLDKGVDVTSESTIYLFKEGGGSKMLDQPIFTTTESGISQFYAIADGRISEKIAIEAFTKIPAAVEDPNPAQFNGFYKRMLALQMTGTWCVWCPLVIKQIHTYDQTNTDGRVLFAASHWGEDPMMNASTMNLNAYFENASFPSVYFNFSKSKQNITSSDLSQEIIIGKQTENQQTPASSIISIASEIVDGKICVRSDVKLSAAGKFRVSCWLLEDDIYFRQDNATDIKDDYINNHQHVIRGIYPLAKDVVYADLGRLDKHEAGKSYTFCAEFDVKAAKVANIEKTQVLVMVYNAETSLCDNVVKCKTGESIAFQYEK